MVDCPYFLNHSRTPCALMEPDGRHCGKNQYPPSPCNLDLIGRGEPWRSFVAQIYPYYWVGPMLIVGPSVDDIYPRRGDSIEEGFGAVGWSP